MNVVEGQSFRNQAVQIDSTRFVDCDFTDCTLYYYGHPMIFERTHLRACKYVFCGTERPFEELLELAGLISSSSRSYLEGSETIH